MNGITKVYISKIQRYTFVMQFYECAMTLINLIYFHESIIIDNVSRI